VISKPSFWHSRNQRPLCDPLRGSVNCDVVVIGAGMTGLSTAIALLDAGLSVTVLESRGVGAAATGRNVGFILEGVAESYSRTISLWGRDKAKQARRFTVENHEQIRALIERFSIRCEYEQRGSIHLAATEGEDIELRDGSAQLVDDGFQAVFIDHTELPAWAQRANYRSAQIIPLDGELDPVAFAQGLADGVLSLGGTLYEGSPALDIQQHSDGVRVRCADGEVLAMGAVVAANAYATSLAPWLAGRLDPTRGQVLCTTPIKEQLFDRPIYASHGFEYWRQLRSGEVVMGGWRNLDMEGEVGFSEDTHPKIQDTMAEFLRNLHPSMSDIEVTSRWAGIMGFSRDSLPIVGPMPGWPAVFLAVGFTGHGFGFSVHAAKVMAELITTGNSPWASLLAPRRLN
jgi:gamma-glutamylputrescine oxidase